MPDRAVLAEAALTLANATEWDSDLCQPLVAALGVSGAAVSTLGIPLGSETVCATDPGVARLDEIQLDLGEGPCWEALATRRPVLEPDVQHSGSTSWPVAREALHATGLGAVFAFPLVAAGINVGALDLYSEKAQPLTPRQVKDAVFLSTIVARQVLTRAVNTATEQGTEGDVRESPYSRREVHQATGMIVAQMHIAAGDALLVLRGHAFATGRTVREAAADVVARELDFTPLR